MKQLKWGCRGCHVALCRFEVPFRSVGQMSEDGAGVVDLWMGGCRIKHQERSHATQIQYYKTRIANGVVATETPNPMG
jgi:hypothetical protein